MFVCGIKRDSPSTEFSLLCMPNGQGHAMAPSVTCVGEVELNREGYIKIPCTVNINDPKLQLPITDPNGSKCVTGGDDNREITGDGQSPTSDKDSIVSQQTSNGTEEAKTVEEEQDEEEEEEELNGEEEDEGSSDIIEHIVKELRGINRIQEEISDLRQYLTSVRGSVDEVSCCVDAVLTEIEGLRSGVLSQRASCSSTRERDKTVQEELISNLLSEYYTWQEDGQLAQNQDGHLARTETTCQAAASQNVGDQGDQDTSDQSSDIPPQSGCSVYNITCLDRQDFPSTSSLSSGRSSKSNESDLEGQEIFPSKLDVRDESGTREWPEDGMQHSVSFSGDAGWSEEEGYFCQRGMEEEQPEAWDPYGGGETSSTPGQSSVSSSEHLSLLFGRHYPSPSLSTSSLADWRTHALHLSEMERDLGQGIKPTLECECTVACPCSVDPDYHVRQGYADDLGSGPSRSLSCNSTIVFTDCDDCYQEGYSSECCLVADIMDEGSGEPVISWTDQVLQDNEGGFQGAEGGFHLDSDHPFPSLESESTELLNMGFSVKRIGKAVLHFKTALRGAFKKLEGTGPHYPSEENINHLLDSPGSFPQEAPWLEDIHVNGQVPSQCSLTDLQLETFSEVSLGGEYPNTNIPENVLSCTTPSDRLGSSCTVLSHCTTAESFSAEDPAALEPHPEDSCSNSECVPELSPAKPEYSPQDAYHLNKCLINFQSVLKQKRLTRRKLSSRTEGSKPSFSEEELNAE
ncbi:uncharacterized protein LOC136755195 [Amia ocellicauda]|uniref:uncharacterized protein LOC136755195 n=1 Tax=Amia ocellicauda TaxID=2972642 RepID=UPI003463BE20